MNYKEKFIEILGDPYDRSKLDQYINFVLNNVSEELKEEHTEKHHILPVSVFGKNTELFCLSYNNHIEAHKLLVEAYPIREFTRPLNFMLSKNSRELIEHRKLISLAAKNAWKKFKKTPQYKIWRDKKSEHMKNQNKNGLASKAGKIRMEKEGAREKIGEHFRLLWQDPEYREKTMKSMKESANTPEAKKRYSHQAKKRWDDMTINERIEFCSLMKDINQNEKKRKDAGKKIKEKWKDPEFKKKMKNRKRGNNSNAMKEKWKDPEFRAMMINRRKK